MLLLQTKGFYKYIFANNVLMQMCAR